MPSSTAAIHIWTILNWTQSQSELFWVEDGRIFLMWRCTDDNFSPLDMLKASEHVNHQKTTAQILTQNHKNELVDLFRWYGSKSRIIICDMWFWSVKTSICFKSEMHKQHYLSDNKLLMISNMWHITEINCRVSQFWHRSTLFSQCSGKTLTRSFS